MASFKDFLKTLFQKQAHVYQPDFLHESFEFDNYSESFILWKGENTHLAFCQKIKRAQSDYLKKEQTDRNLEYFISDKFSGISLNCKGQPFKERDYLFLTAELIARLKKDGYILSLSEVRSTPFKGNVKKSIKAYLKPSRKLVIGNQAQQLYGNIIMELISINGKLDRYHIKCNYYNDQHFLDPKDFKLFVQNYFDYV